MEKDKTVLVISAYNEEKTIADVIKSAKPYCDSIVVVSAKKAADNTRNIARSLGAEVLIDNGKGKGEGMRLAINAINEGILVFIDADGSHITKDIPNLVKPIKEGKADMAIGSRMLGGSMELHGTFNKLLRFILSMMIAQIINWRFHTSIADTQNGFRAIRAKAYPKIRWQSTDYSVEAEMLANAGRNKLKCIEVPIETRYLNRYKGTTIIDGINIFIQMVIWRLRHL